jgi:hypothetical protein
VRCVQSVLNSRRRSGCGSRARILLVEGGESGADCQEDGPEMVNQPTVVFTAVIVQSNVHGTRTTRNLRAGESDGEASCVRRDRGERLAKCGGYRY